MIKRLKASVFNRRVSIKTKETSEEKMKINVEDETPKNSLANFNMKIEKEKIENKRDLDIDKILGKLDVLEEKAKKSISINQTLVDKSEESVEDTSVEDTSVEDTNEESLNINEKIQGLENSLVIKYESIGYTSEEARVIVELQEMNKHVLPIEDVINYSLDMEYVYQMWFNEVVIEELNRESIENQTLVLLNFQLVDAEKIRQTKMILNLLSEEQDIYSKGELKAMDLYFEKNLIEIATTEIEDRESLISKLNEKIDVLINTNIKYNTNQSELINDSCKVYVKNITANLPEKVFNKTYIKRLESAKHLNGLAKDVLKSINTNSKDMHNSNQNFIDEVAHGKELIKFTETSNISVILSKLKLEIDKYGLDYFTTEYIQQKYMEAGLSEIDAKLLIELQEKNFDKLDIKTVIDNKIPSAFIKNLWFNEIINEFLSKFKMEDQTLILIRYNLVDKVKLNETQILLDKILLGKTSISEFDLRKLDLFFEDELVEMLRSSIELKEKYYNALHENIVVLRKSLDIEKHTLETTGNLYGITRERVRQIDKKMITRLSMLSETFKKHLNENFLLGLDQLALSVLGHKPIKEIEYFVNGVVAPTQYFVDEYNLKAEHYIYNNKALPKQNKALFEEYMSSYDNKQYSAQEILNDFIESLKNAGIYDEVMKKDEVELREVQGRLSRMDNIIHAGQYYRKHNIKSSEIEELITRIEEQDLPNVFSANLLMTEEIVNGLDILDENEMHNILKKNAPFFNEDIQFSRMPHMSIGKVDMVEELYQIVDVELLSSNPEQALAELSEITGIKTQTLAGSYYQKIINLVPNENFAVEGLFELTEQLSNINIEVVHVEVLSEKYDITLSNKIKELLKVKEVAGFRLRSNWLLKEKYKSVSEYIESNVDEYSIFNENKLGASKYVHNYTTMRKSLRLKNIYRLNSNELFRITDKTLINKIDSLKDDVLYEIEFPFSLSALLEDDRFDAIIEKNNLDIYGFSSIFWEDVLMSIDNLRLDGNIVIDKSTPIEYSDYIEGFVCSIYDYEEEFKEVIGCEPPPKYVRKLEEEGVFIKDNVIYMEKEIYLNELRSVV